MSSSTPRPPASRPVADRKGPCPCGSGRRYKSCCWDKDQHVRGCDESARQSHRAIDEVMRVIVPLVESRGEYTIACKAGCNACCTHLVRISWPEALPIVDWLLEPAQAELLAEFLPRLEAWRAAIGAETDAVEAFLKRHRTAPTAFPDVEPYAESMRAYERKGVMCPFNRADGNCGIYPVRPVICRAFTVVGTAEHCAPGSSTPPSVVRHPAIDGTLIDVRRLMAGATGGARGEEERIMPSAVAELLAGAGRLPGRAAP